MPSRRNRQKLDLLSLAVLLLASALAGCAWPLSDPVLVGAGDIASCDGSGDEATAALLDTTSGTVFANGDTVYGDESAADFANCYGPSWGRLRSRTRPALGNREYLNRDAATYFDYFGSAAGERSKGYYSYELGTWHIIVLNSNCSEISCAAGSPQEQWLRADLAAHPGRCTLAYWHHPRFSSGAHGDDIKLRPFWQALYEAGAEAVLNGHDHDYERFAPQNPDGLADPAHGIREFIVGTGGIGFTEMGKPVPNSEVHQNDTLGVLKLTLHPASYDWQFIPVAGKTFVDSGSAACH